MKYYLKQFSFPFVYLIFMSLVAFAISAIGNDVLEIVLYVACIGLYTALMIMSNFKEGQEARKILHSNDLERRYMVEHGELRDIRPHEEYKPWKGFLFGIVTSAPLILCMLVHLILFFATGGTSNQAGAVAAIIYMLFYAPFESVLSVTVGSHYFMLLYVVAYLALVMGIPYILGAKKMQKTYDVIAEKQTIIYGENKK